MSNLDGISPNKNHLGVYNPPKRRRFKKLIFWIVLLAVLGTATWAGFRYLSQFNQIFTNKKNIFTRVGSFFLSQDKPLIGEDQGLVNILLMGIGGEGHDGAHLTDTMIVASINTNTHEVVLTSIPRDWLVTIPKRGLNKINAVYAYGLQDYSDDPNQAGMQAIIAAEKVTGFDIPYYALVDFKGFVKAIDHVDGIDVDIAHTFTDATFPNDFPYDTKGYLSPVSFTKGPAHLDGRRALIFARSRHSGNSLEGSDFARSERQKKIIVSLKDKLLNLKITDVSTLNNLLSDFTGNFRTNLEPYELMRLANLGKELSGDNIYSFSIEPTGDLICDTTIDQLTGEPYIRPKITEPANDVENDEKTSVTTDDQTSNQTQENIKSSEDKTVPTPAASRQIAMYIVKPCPGKTVDDIHQFLVNYWETARLAKEGAKLEVQNSTGKTAASADWKKLTDLGLSVTMVPFPGKTSFERTILYDNTKGSKSKTLQYLKNKFQFDTADVQFTNSKADFVIILGSDAL